MRFWAVLAASLLTASVDAYVSNWDAGADPAETLKRLERRADTCPSNQPTSCKAVDSKLPGNFCCDSDKQCLSVDRSSSAICCPKDSDCATIRPIDCDITLQSKGPIWTTRLKDKLPTCGSQCCPFGYKCSNINGESACTLVKADAGPATTTTSTAKTSATVTTTPTGIGLNSDDPPEKKENAFPLAVFFAGFFPGLVVGVLGTLAWVIYTKRNAKPDQHRPMTMAGNGARPFISAPLKDDRHSTERSDFLGRTRSRARSMFSTQRATRIVDSPDIWSQTKMPTPPVVNNIPVNYVNDMPDVPITPRRRIARAASDHDLYQAPHYQENDLTPVTPGDNDPNRPETIRVYSPDLTQELKNTNIQHPSAAVPPLRGMNSQRRISPEYNSMMPPQRRDSGKGMGTFGSPFQTPEKKPVITNNNTSSMHATYHDAATFESPTEPVPQLLTPARYERGGDLAPSAAANLAASRLGNAQQSLPSQQGKPIIPPRPTRPETQYSEDFDFDNGIDDHSPIQQSPPREAYKSQAVSNPYALDRSRVNPASTFDNLIPTAPSSQFDGSKKNKHATNMTTFTTMLRNVGIPDSGNQLGVPAVPKVDMKKVKANNKKGMI